MTRIINPSSVNFLGTSSSSSLARRRRSLCNTSSSHRRGVYCLGRPSPIWAQVEAGGGTTTSSSEEDLLKDLLKSPAKERKPVLLFPWRHGTDLPRRIEERKENLLRRQKELGGGSVGSRDSLNFEHDLYTWFVTTMTGWNYYNISFFGSFRNQWRTELAQSCSWAFVQGVCGILSNTYDVPVDPYGESKDDNDEDGISINFFYNKNTTAEAAPAVTSVDEAESNMGSPDMSSEEKEEEEGGISTKEDSLKDSSNNHNDNSQSQLLFETNLSNLYRDAHKSGRDQIQICLECTPMSAELLSLHFVQGLSRNMAASHPNLLQEISDIVEEASNDRSYVGESLGKRYMFRVWEETGKIETTIFADVLVKCYERFWVKDLQTGKILQGSGDNKFREVNHVVRMERVSTDDIWKPFSKATLSNWIITDIDDLLDGNRWFTPAVRHWWNAG